jgi:hypothetical protein
MKTPQTKQRPGAKNSTITRRDSDSGQTESDGEYDIDFKEKLERLIAESKKRSTTTHKAESEDHVSQRLVSQGNKLNADHSQALVSCPSHT